MDDLLRALTNWIQTEISEPLKNLVNSFDKYFVTDNSKNDQWIRNPCIFNLDCIDQRFPIYGTREVF